MTITKNDIRERYELGNEIQNSAVGTYDAAVLSANPKLYYKFENYNKYRTQVLADGPLVYLPLNEKTGTTATDLSGNANNGTYQGGYTLNQDPIVKNTNGDSCINMGEADADKVLGTSLGTLDFPVTLECWQNWDQMGTGTNLIGTHSDQNIAYKGFYLIKIASGDELWAIYGLGGSGFGTGTSRRFHLSSFAFQAGVTYHIVAVFHSQTDVRIYINGIEQTIDLIDGTQGPVDTSSGNYTVANANTSGAVGGSRGSGGDMQEAAIYNVALSASQVYEHYRLGISGDIEDVLNNYDGNKFKVPGGATGLITSDPLEFSIDFDGTKKYLNLGRYFNYTDVFSIECWVLPDHTNTGATRPIFTRWGSGSNDNVSLHIIDDTLYFGVRDSDTTTWRQVTATISKEKHYIVAIYDPNASNKLELYIDGVLASSLATAFTIDTTSIDEKISYIGRLGSDGANDNYSGTIDDFAIYNSTLTTGQITQHWNLGKDPDSAYTAAVIKHSPLVYYKMDNISEPLFVDSSGNGYNLVSDDYSTISFKKASLLNTDTSNTGLGLTGYGFPLVSPGNTNVFSGLNFPVTIEGWFKLDAIGINQEILNTHQISTAFGGFNFYVDSVGKLIAIYGDGVGFAASNRYGAYTTSNVISAATKYHVAAVFTNSTTVAIYLNGVSQAITYFGTGSTLNTSIGYLQLGANLSGTLDEVAIYNSALSGASILANYNAGDNAGGYEALILGKSPLGYWRMNDDGGTIIDSSGNNNDGSMYGRRSANQTSLLAGEVNSLLFDSTATTDDAVINGPSLGSISFPITLELWWEPTDLSNSQIGLLATHADSSNYAGAALSYSTTSNNLNLAIGDGSGQLSSDVRFYKPNAAYKFYPEVGKLYHIVIVLEDFNTVSFYINGAKIPLLDVTGTGLSMATGLGTVKVGWWGTFTGVGYYDEVAIYNTILTEADIDEHYQLGILGDVSLSSYQAEVVGDSPIAYWRLNEQKDYASKVLSKTPTVYYKMQDSSGTTIVDSSGNSYNGTISTSGTGSYALSAVPLVIDGKNSIQFNSASQGNGAKVVGPYIGTMTFPVTLEGWVHIDSFTNTTFPVVVTHEVLDTTYKGFTLSINNNGAIRALYGDGTGLGSTNYRGYITDPSIITTGKKYHVVAVFPNNTTCTVYVNGIAYSTTNDAGTSLSLSTTSGVITIGSRDTSATAGTEYYANGRIDHVAVYESELTATEILDHYSEGIAIFDTIGNYDGEAFGNLIPSQKSLVGDLLSKSTDINGYFNGGNYIFVNSAPLGGGDIDVYTIELWAMTYHIGSDGGYMVNQSLGTVNNNNILLNTRNTANLEFRFDKDLPAGSTFDTTLAGSLLPGEIFHLVYQEVNATRRFILNGVIIKEDTSSETYTGSTADRLFLANWYALDNSFGGVMGEIALYNYEVPLKRLQKHYIEGLRGNKSPESYETEIIKNSPLAFIRCIETTGTVLYDYSGTGNDFDLYNTPTLGNTALHGGIHPGRSFQTTAASSQYANCPNAIVGTADDVTLEAWYVPQAATATDRLFIRRDGGGSDDWDIYMIAAPDVGYIAFQVVTTSGGLIAHNCSITDFTLFTIGEPMHIVGTFEQGVGMKLFLNGTQIAELTSGVNSTLRGATGGWNISKWNYGGPTYYNSKVQDVAIYNTVLTEQDIFNHYIEGSRTITYNGFFATQQNMPNITPLAIWKLNETSGTTAIDSSGNGNNLSYLNGATPGNESLVPEEAGQYSGNTDFAVGTGPEISASALTYNALTGNNCLILEVLFKLDSIDASFGGGLLCTHDNGTDYAGVSLLSAAADGHLILRVGAGSGGGMTDRKSWITTEPLTVGRIYHAVAIVQDINTVFIYLNGVELSTSISTAGTPSINLSPAHAADTGMGTNTSNISEPNGYHLDAKFGYAAIYQSDSPCRAEVARSLWLRNGNYEPYYEQVKSLNPFAHWSMNHDGIVTNNETLVEDIGNVSNGTIVEAVNIDGVVGQVNNRFRRNGAIHFNGNAGDYANLGYLGALTWPLTVEFWFIPYAFACRIFTTHVDLGLSVGAEHSGFWINGTGTSKLQVGYGSGLAWGDNAGRYSKETIQNFSTLTRYHVVAQWLGSQSVKIFINGVEDAMQTATGTATTALTSGVSRVCTLAYTPNLGASTTGDFLIDSLTIYKYQLSSAQILANYNAGA